MELSKIHFSTLKEVPKDVEIISHELMLRAGYIRQMASGIYSYLPFGLKLINNIKKIIKEEMDRIGGQEFLLPVLTPKEIWMETNRWKDFGDEMFRLKDRKGREFALSPTHEEIITDLARREIKSYKELPQIWYQIQTKFRDEPRPRSGLLRVRQFEMKDSYSLDTDFTKSDISYEKHKNAYNRIFKRCGLDFVIVKASSGLMGGNKSEEFMAFSKNGESNIIVCTSCKAASNSDVARCKLDYDKEESKALDIAYTPVEGTIESISNFMKIKKSSLMKSILFIVKRNPVFVLIPGDREIDEEKITLLLGEEFRYAKEDEIMNYISAPVGFISPISKRVMNGKIIDSPIEIKIIADISLKERVNLVSGANKKDYHFTGIDMKRDIPLAEFADLIKIKDGDKCTECGGELEITKTIEIGHIFQLGTKYSESMHALFLDSDGSRKPIVMGSYGIGLGRVASTIAEQYNDKDGLKWPITVAPFKLIVIPLNPSDKKQMESARNLYNNLRNIDSLLDDRDISPGVKFKDADLIGIPIKIIFGRNFALENKIEISIRSNNIKEIILLEECEKRVRELIKDETDKYNAL
ncbi:MAG: proline--tRNA ligase [bacterium (Candidatus Stahlbacteria) CG23_combo_of_CG06-09_8_20_14_all_34_7]|nr:MAG: proline--tRNA ligase [bacterium (Candidatus Stahlbacteria) CG23_combo_of_CG06-09_8_20_14_all_34_7]